MLFDSLLCLIVIDYLKLLIKTFQVGEVACMVWRCDSIKPCNFGTILGFLFDHLLEVEFR